MIGRSRWPSVLTALSAVGSGLWSLSVLAESPPQGAEVAADYLTRLVGGLAMIVALILLLAWILRRLPGMAGAGRQVIEVLAVRPVGTRERLLLVQVGEEQVLLGVTPTGIRHLHTLQTRIVVPPTEPPAGDFASLLKRVTDRGASR